MPIHMEARMFRSIVAFLVTPLVVPLLFAASYLGPDAPSSSLDVLAGLFITLVAYSGTLLVGLPTYLFLRNKKWTAFWIAPIAGFIVATVTWYVLLTFVPLFFLPRLTQLATLLNALWPMGPIGALVGALLWLIARPDRTNS